MTIKLDTNTGLVHLTGHDAIEFATNHGLDLEKLTDPTEEARAVSTEEAREIAKEDPGLVRLTLPGALGFVEYLYRDAWGEPVTEDEHDAACQRGEDWLTDNEGDALSIRYRPTTNVSHVGVFSVDDYGREHRVSSVPDDVKELLRQAYEHACETWPKTPAT